MQLKFDKESVQKLADEVLLQAKNVLSYLLLPVSIPLLFCQETYIYLREVTGMGKRSLEGQVVLITGSSSGIGESLAKVFYTAGCKLILASRRKEELERVKDELVRLHTTGTVYVPAVVEMDLSQVGTLSARCKTALDIYGRIDILVNNAGVSHRGSVLDTEVEVAQRIMNVNYFGTSAITREIAKSMVEKRSGSIVFVSSLQSKIALPYRSAYCASKHALVALADSLRAELSACGVNVTIVHPGYVRTNLSINALTGSGERHNQMDANTEKGYTPSYVAEQIFNAVRRSQKEVFVCNLVHRLAVFLRTICPRIFFYLMAWRAQRSQE